ncbi:hypothetical protein KFL_001770190 [Klebsormidium nitens]|uniref:Uncharacterized protein n=1 Tax=Klebsormidium nitens TaxID=105231 RepID=A0A1Y1I101_KLENI|nr:hypothetical protein KFL_001770190 [Klebsormidium nitens]|eukprot:GAQ84133.1 hypothetical protein KFL_001770190 [Klebsormidium nitens]
MFVAKLIILANLIFARFSPFSVWERDFTGLAKMVRPAPSLPFSLCLFVEAFLSDSIERRTPEPGFKSWIGSLNWVLVEGSKSKLVAKGPGYLPLQLSADMIHPDRLTPFGKVAIFVGGCVVVALTTLDIHRSIRYNEQPPSKEQMAAFEQRIHDVRQNEALRGLSGLPGLGDSEPSNKR